jgi:two-component sensor histidine kinase
MINSFKHAYPKGAQKTMTVGLKKEAGDRILFHYSDHYDLFKQKKKAEDSGFHGSDLIDILITELDAKRLSSNENYDLAISFTLKSHVENTSDNGKKRSK